MKNSIIREGYTFHVDLIHMGNVLEKLVMNSQNVSILQIHMMIIVTNESYFCPKYKYYASIKF